MYIKAGQSSGRLLKCFLLLSLDVCACQVIHEKPSDPHAFLSEQILKHVDALKCFRISQNARDNDSTMQLLVFLFRKFQAFEDIATMIFSWSDLQAAKKKEEMLEYGAERHKNQSLMMVKSSKSLYLPFVNILFFT